ncbi:hypothetical protein F0L17_16265 [Streptomyces sp. TRM43335]|uniref:Uncharacterized protein n=1 Tax=Streptomyces taklimakanensis TaxID=2569853 RepID=A0A6G2BEK1_9ACTN|nr:hypothetical protein [Streptomyces taklimakanensis]MTE20634.1 hypothetical protein [Streptomyces taklimakanensis]
MRPHRFEPARLLLGLSLLGVAVAHVLTATGRWEVPLPVLLSLVPAALLSAGAVSAATHAVRRRRGRRRGEPAGDGASGAGG